jgi:hypothetical protein
MQGILAVQILPVQILTVQVLTVQVLSVQILTVQVSSGYPRDHRSADGPKSVATDGPTGQARGITASESPADVYLKVKLNGRVTFALMDTGCENNICGRRLIPDVDLLPTSQRLFAASGTPVTLLGQTVLNINVNGVFISVEVVVSDAVDELILGLPFLRQHACQWNFETSHLSIDGKAARLQSRPSRNQVRRIYAQRDVRIPPNHAIDVPVLITRPKPRQSAEQWAIEPKRLGEGVLSARTLVSDDAVVASVIVMNRSDHRCRVRRGTFVGEAKAVSLVDVTELSGPTGAPRGDGAATETQTLVAGSAACCEQSTEADPQEERPADVGLNDDGETSVKTANMVVTMDLIDLTNAESGGSGLEVRLNASNDFAAGTDRNDAQNVSNRLIVVDGEQCRAVGRDAGEGGLQAGNSGPQSPPTPASDAISAAETDRSSNCWTVDGELSCENLRREQGTDSVIRRMVDLLTTSNPVADWTAVTEDELEVQALFAQRQALEVREGVLYRQFQRSDGAVQHYQAVIPRSMRLAVMSHIHGSLLAGHLGKLKSGKRLMKVAYWPGWRTDVSLFIDRCEKCNRYRKNTHTRQGQLKYAGVTAPWQKVHIDLMGPFVKSHDGYSFILTVICSFTKYLIAIPLRDKSAFSVARALVRQVFLVYSPVELLVHDNGGEFCNTLQSSINQLLDIQNCRVTRYRPSANGVVERSHATLNKLFATSVNENQRNWSDCLPYVAYAYNTAYHTSTTFTPFFLMFLREPRMGIDMVSETYTAAEFSSPEEYAHVMRERMQGAYRLVHDHLKAAFARAKRRYDVRVRECQFKVGDQVWYFSPRKYRHRSPKWSLQTSGPFEVVRRVNDVNYVIRKSNRHPSFTVHIDRLRRYCASAGVDRAFPRLDVPQPDNPETHDENARGTMNGLLDSVALRSECESTSGEMINCIA